MSFLNPAWLWGLLALVIPVIVHLFNFRKTRRIYFSNTRFIKKVQEASKSRRKLKHYLVLMSRMLFIFWFVMAFAQPFIPASKGNLQQERVYFYLDNSYSMSRLTGDQLTALDEGIEYIQQLIEIYPTGTDFYLLTNDFAPYSHAPHSGSQLSELLTEVKLTGVVRSADEITNRWKSQQVMEGDGDYYFISDLQKSTFGIEKLEEADSLFSIRLVPLTSTSKANIYIDTVYLDNPFLIGKERVRLHVGLTNDAATDASEIPVAIYIDNVQIGSTTTALSAGGRKIIDFDLMVNPDITSLGRISIEEYPITFDNDLYFVLDLGEKINVVEIKEGASKTSVARVFGNESLFSFSDFSYGNFDYNVLEIADLVILNGIRSIDPSLTAAIQNYMQQGGSVLLVPATQPDIDSYRNIFGGISATDTTFRSRIMTPNFDNPFFEQVFEERNPAIEMPQAAPVITWNGGSGILRIADGNPFLSVFNEKLFLLSTPLEDDYTDMHKHALFVPVMYKIAALSSKQEQPLYHYLDERLLVFSMDTVNPSGIFKLAKEQEEIIPEQRFVNQRLLLQLPAYMLSTGYYKLINQERTLEIVAFNINKAESNMETLSEQEVEELRRAFPSLIVYAVNDVAEFRSTIEGEYVGWSLWKYCLILAILFLLTEILIIRFIP